MAFEFTLANILIGFGTVLGSLGAGVSVGKKVPFFKGTPDSNKCSDNGCHDKVIETTARVDTLEKGQAKIFEKLDDMPMDIVRLLKDTKDLL